MSRGTKNKPLKTKLPFRGRKKGAVRYIRMTRKVGRPPKLTEKLIEDCVELILEGLPINRTCDYLGITQDSFYDWKQRGEKWLQEVSSGHKPEYPEYELHGLFVQCVVRAKATWMLEILRRSMQNASKKTSMWIRDMTLMERRDRSNWGRSETVSITDSAPLPDDSYL